MSEHSDHGATTTVSAVDPGGPRAPRTVAVRRLASRLADDGGAATAEYAITIMAAVGFAGLLVVILKSGEVQKILTDLVHKALTVAG
ncbi:DUF4244 domain-containing protein [Schumannella sp. 10F1B-5-1]|uniref:DUF4244 domain-containing protein n=1 Tax=Schumannella sp. 10F1B-5-1 TaxID=2590780 RepID=UPI00113067AC|nr:DUF4244 domain-containing protein [Schumannella sp. 10F1B-5-1]